MTTSLTVTRAHLKSKPYIIDPAFTPGHDATARALKEHMSSSSSLSSSPGQNPEEDNNLSQAHLKSKPYIIDPAYSVLPKEEIRADKNSNQDNIATTTRCWLYGDGELESYRLSVLRQQVSKAKLNVYYPGKFHAHSHKGWFRFSRSSSLQRTTNTDTLSLTGVSVRSNGMIKLLSSTNDKNTDNSVICQSQPCDDKKNLLYSIKLSHEDFSSSNNTLLFEVETMSGEPPCIQMQSTLEHDDDVLNGFWEWSCNEGHSWSPCKIYPSPSADSDSTFPHLANNQVTMELKPMRKTADGVYDFGVELLGHVVVVATNCPLLYVGESVEEALNEDPAHFEQSTEMVPLEEGTWISAHLLAFRYARIILPTKEPGSMAARNITLSCRAVFCPVSYRGGFCCNLPELCRIYMSSAYTLKLCCYQGFIVDGIKRDRLPWAGDLAVSLLCNAYVFYSPKIVAQTLTVLGNCDGNINGILDYSLWWIICQDLYQQYFGLDQPFLSREWSRIKNTISSMIRRCDKRGMLAIQEEDWIFIDWVENMVKTTSLQILWWWALQSASALAKRMEYPEQAQEWDAYSVRLKQELYKSCWDSCAGLWCAAPNIEEHSRHANILAVMSGLTTKNNNDAIRDALSGNVLDAVGTPYMKYFECLALSRLGANKESLEILQTYWGGMLDKGATTFWEAFDFNETDSNSFYGRPFGRSLCHAWSAGPCHGLAEIIFGIRPLTDGWREWTFSQPDLVGDQLLEWACITVPTPHGQIEMNATAESTEVVIPSETTLKFNGHSYVGPQTLLFPMNEVETESHTIDSNTVKQWSAPYRNWYYYPDHVIPAKPNIPGYEKVHMTDVPTVYQLPDNDKTYYMTFIGFDGQGYQSFVAESNDLVNWTNMRLAMGFGNDKQDFDYGGCVLGAFLYEDYNIKGRRVLKRKDGKFWSLYGAYSKRGSYEIDPGYEGLACSENGITWSRAKEEPILSVFDSDTKDWEKDSIYQPCLLQDGDTYYNFYNAKRMPQWIEQIGLATSNDLQTWKRHADNPLLRVRPNGFDSDFCSDGKVFRDGNHWTIFYFGVGHGGAHIMVAFSRDLIHWTANPEPLYKAGGNPSGLDRQYAHKISLVWNPANDTWYMFYCAVGKHGRGIGLITSKPLSK